MKIGTLLKLSCFFLFMGRGWQHYIGDIPLRALLWNEGLLKPVVESLFQITWQQWASSPLLDSVINNTSRVLGVFYLILGLFCFRFPVKLRWLLPISSFTLLFVFILQFMAKFFYIGMLIEHGIQFIMPFALYWYLKNPYKFSRYESILKICCALTFIGHGMFAIGYYPVPGHFQDMLINVFKVSNQQALMILKVAGSLDFAAALLLFIPMLNRFALVFMTFWGLTTAFARLVAHLDMELLQYNSIQWAPETLYRLPHGLIPLVLLLMLKKSKRSL